MQRIQHILFPIDFSDRCLRIAPAVSAMARRFDAEVTLLHMLDLPVGAYADWYAYAAMVDVESIKTHTKNHLNNLFPGEFDGIKVTRVQRDGIPAPGIVEFARDAGADLIMMPTKGQSRFRSLLLGSVTAGVLHDAECPVWTEAHVEQGAPIPRDYKSILCAVDFASGTGRVLRWGQQLAHEYGASLTVMHAVPAAEGGPSHATEEIRRYLFEEANKKYAPIAKEAGLEPRLALYSGPVGRSVAEAGEDCQADLVVIGRGVIQGVLGRLRTNAYQIIRSAGCPVLSL